MVARGNLDGESVYGRSLGGGGAGGLGDEVLRIATVPTSAPCRGRVFQICKMLPWGELGEEYAGSLLFFFHLF